MQKVFLFFTSILVALLMVFIINDNPKAHIFKKYDTVFISANPDNISVEEIKKTIHDLALSKNSLIGSRIIVSMDNSKSEFFYQKLGKGDFPKEIKEAKDDLIKKTPKVEGFTILRGKVTIVDIERALAKHKITAWKSPSRTSFNLAFIFLSEISIFGFISLVLVYFAIVLVNELGKIRKVGIELINGQKISSLIFQKTKSNLYFLLFSYLLSVAIGITALNLLKINNSYFMQIVLFAVLIYLMIMFLMKILISTLILKIVNKSRIIMLIKGKIPVKLLFSIILISQFIAFSISAYLFYNSTLFYDFLNEYNELEKIWSKHQDRYNIVRGFSDTKYSIEKRKAFSNSFFNLVKEAENDNDLILVSANFINDFKELSENRKIKLNKKTYDSSRLIVNYNFIKSQNIEVSASLEEKIKSFKEGECALILPEKLKKEEAKILKLAKKELKQVIGTNPKINLEYKNFKNKVFIFNNYLAIARQFYEEPILLLITTKSSSRSYDGQIFWENRISQGLYFKDFEDTKNLLKKYNVEKEFSYVENSRSNFVKMNEFTRFIFSKILMITVVLIISSIFLFSSMHSVYFEQFRRKIFIKRISGYTFFENHWVYLLSQGLTILLSLIFVSFYYGVFEEALIMLPVFAFISFIIFVWMTKSKKAYNVSIIKGE